MVRLWNNFINAAKLSTPVTAIVETGVLKLLPATGDTFEGPRSRRSLSSLCIAPKPHDRGGGHELQFRFGDPKRAAAKIREALALDRSPRYVDTCSAVIRWLVSRGLHFRFCFTNARLDDGKKLIGLQTGTTN